MKQSRTAGPAVLDGPAGRHIPGHPDALLFPSEVAFILGVSVRTLESWRLYASGPEFLAISPRACRYRRRDLDAWLNGRRRKSTSDPGPSEPEAAA